MHIYMYTYTYIYTYIYIYIYIYELHALGKKTFKSSPNKNISSTLTPRKASTLTPRKALSPLSIADCNTRERGGSKNVLRSIVVNFPEGSIKFENIDPNLTFKL
jgi:hypothetical protein